MSDDRPGYDDSPTLPNCDYGVHDSKRPRPDAVDPGAAASLSVISRPPDDATVLFDGTDLSAWEADDGGDPEWTIEDDVLRVTPGTGDVRTRESIGDCQLHLEWRATTADDDGGQDRSNSGVFLMDRYEIQVLDCYRNPTYADGYAGAVYGQQPPLVNACLEPGVWQSFDVVWRGPRFDGEEVERPARVTVLHNGLVVQDATELIGSTTHREVGEYEPHPPEAPLRLQDHGDPVEFRNMWYRPLR